MWVIAMSFSISVVAGWPVESTVTGAGFMQSPCWSFYGEHMNVLYQPQLRCPLICDLSGGRTVKCFPLGVSKTSRLDGRVVKSMCWISVWTFTCDLRVLCNKGSCYCSQELAHQVTAAAPKLTYPVGVFFVLLSSGHALAPKLWQKVCLHCAIFIIMHKLYCCDLEGKAQMVLPLWLVAVLAYYCCGRFLADKYGKYWITWAVF